MEQQPSPSLPPELAGQILEYLGLDPRNRKRNLMNASMCSIAFLIEAERILYSSVTVLRERHARSLLHALRSSPRGLARRTYVTSLDASCPTTFKGGFFQFSVRQILNLTPNLTDLAIRGGEGTNALIMGVKYFPFRLRSLRVMDCYDDVIPLLISQPSITNLQLGLKSPCALEHLPAHLRSSLPCLQDIEAPTRIILRWLEGHPISRISTVISSPSDARFLAEALSQTNTRIRSLRVTQGYLSRELLAPLSHSLTDLEELELYQTSDSHTFLSFDWLPALSKCSKLQRIRSRYSYRDYKVSRGGCFGEKMVHRIRDFRATCPALNWIRVERAASINPNIEDEVVYDYVYLEESGTWKVGSLGQ
ncbi:hypothetical protein FRB94_011374 [Tulasnella sp. JGI-2019a]|nr:hypothetical protein FRB93_009999 [Tulasnella sp. JGI-2019a]KAG8992728.1 hypothetical protein FRB94_011374 [Tulasnella sp. JGI-2019a]KAG9029904.1 hypothetical protein FRB95_004734 [Tulasnella sp. JGI-2019a]